MVARFLSAGVFFLLCAAASAGGVELTFRATTGSSVTVYTERVQAVPGGFHAVATSALEQGFLEMDANLRTLSWTLQVPSEKTRVEAVLSGTTIRARGQFRGAAIDATFDTRGLPWYEYQELSLDAFGSGPAQTLGFVTIDRSTMKLVTFRIRKTGPAEISLQGVNVPAVEAVLLIDGVPEFLLRSRVWLRRTDGRYLRLSVPPLGGIGSSTLIELTGETASP